MGTLRILAVAEAQSLIIRRTVRLAEAESAVAPILEDVRARGDAALVEYARRFDRTELEHVRVPQADFEAAAARLSAEFLRAVEVAAANIRAFAKLKIPQE